MKLRYPSVKFTIFATTIFTFTVLFNNGCTKLDSFYKGPSPEDLEAKFFNAKPGTPQTVLKVINALKKQNVNSHFIPLLAKNDGYAAWDKSQVSLTAKPLNRNGESEDETLVFTPIVQQDSNFVNGFFFSKIIGDSVELHLYRGNDFDQYPYGKVDSTVVTAELVAMKLLELDQYIFGIRKYQINDDSLFYQYTTRANSTRFLKPDFSTGGGSSQSLLGMACWYIPSGVCNCVSDNGCLDWQNGCSVCSALYCEPVVTGPTTTPGTGGTPWPPDPPIQVPASPSGSGEGGNNTPPSNGNCTGTSNCGTGGSIIVFEKVPCGGCGPGPVIVVPPDEPTFNPYYADTVIIDQSLANYPCVTRIIDSLTGYANINALAQVALNTVFNLEEKIQLTFKADSTLIGLGEDGKTNYNTAQTIGDTYYATILLNPVTLSSATEEFIASTIIHESIHSYINYQYDRYLTGLIDSNQFKNLFPLYWPKRNSSGTIIVSNSAQHQAMAANMIQIMTQPLISLFPNASIPSSRRDSVYRALSWAGLEGTYSWSIRPDTSYINAVNVIAKDTTVNAPFYLNGNSNIVYQFDSHNLNMIRGCK